MKYKKESKSKRLPLKGRTILVTQAESQANRFSLLLKKKGATVLECPTIEILPYEAPQLARTFLELKSYDWAVFMSQNAVHYFFEKRRKRNLSKQVLKGVRIAAIGKTTKEALKYEKVRVTLTPQVYESQALAQAFTGAIEGKKFLILTSLQGRTVLQEELIKRGAKVDVLPLYRTILPQKNAERLKKYLSEEVIDAITFTSPSTVENFVAMLNPNGERSIHRKLELLTIAALGDVTAKRVEDLGLRVRVQPSEYTIPSFVNTLSREL